MVALAAYTAHNLPDGMEPGLKETAFYDPTNFTFRRALYLRTRGRCGTGKTSFVNFVAADDSPADQSDDRGRQVHGGLAQGIGQACLKARFTTPAASS